MELNCVKWTEYTNTDLLTYLCLEYNKSLSSTLSYKTGELFWYIYYIINVIAYCGPIKIQYNMIHSSIFNF